MPNGIFFQYHMWNISMVFCCKLLNKLWIRRICRRCVLGKVAFDLLESWKKSQFLIRNSIKMMPFIFWKSPQRPKRTRNIPTLHCVTKSVATITAYWNFTKSLTNSIFVQFMALIRHLMFLNPHEVFSV